MGKKNTFVLFFLFLFIALNSCKKDYRRSLENKINKLLQKKDYKTAEILLKKEEIRNKRERPFIYYLFAKVYFSQSKFAESFNKIKFALQDTSLRFKLLCLLDSILLKIENKPYYEPLYYEIVFKILEIDSTRIGSERALKIAEYFYQKGEIQKALKFYKIYLNGNPDDFDIFVKYFKIVGNKDTIAIESLKRKNFLKAETVITVGDACLHMAWKMYESSKYDSAILFLNKYFYLKEPLERRGEALLLLANCYIRKGEFQEAKRVLQNVIIDKYTKPEEKEVAQKLLSKL